MPTHPLVQRARIATHAINDAAVSLVAQDRLVRHHSLGSPARDELEARRVAYGRANSRQRVGALHAQLEAAMHNARSPEEHAALRKAAQALFLASLSHQSQLADLALRR